MGLLDDLAKHCILEHTIRFCQHEADYNKTDRATVQTNEQRGVYNDDIHYTACLQRIRALEYEEYILATQATHISQDKCMSLQAFLEERDTHISFPSNDNNELVMGTMFTLMFREENAYEHYAHFQAQFIPSFSVDVEYTHSSDDDHNTDSASENDDNIRVLAEHHNYARKRPRTEEESIQTLQSKRTHKYDARICALSDTNESPLQIAQSRKRKQARTRLACMRSFISIISAPTQLYDTVAYELLIKAMLTHEHYSTRDALHNITTYLYRNSHGIDRNNLPLIRHRAFTCELQVHNENRRLKLSDYLNAVQACAYDPRSFCSLMSILDLLRHDNIMTILRLLDRRIQLEVQKQNYIHAIRIRKNEIPSRRQYRHAIKNNIEFILLRRALIADYKAVKSLLHEVYDSVKLNTQFNRYTKDAYYSHIGIPFLCLWTLGVSMLYMSPPEAEREKHKSLHNPKGINIEDGTTKIREILDSFGVDLSICKQYRHSIGKRVADYIIQIQNDIGDISNNVSTLIFAHVILIRLAVMVKHFKAQVYSRIL